MNYSLKVIKIKFKKLMTNYKIILKMENNLILKI